jgi:hypothetical protein
VQFGAMDLVEAEDEMVRKEREGGVNEYKPQ